MLPAQNDSTSPTVPNVEDAQPSSTSAPPMRDKRVLACVLCQQRKIKCDRNFPCQHCTKARVQCVPAGQLPRRRKRRFAERELLEQLKRYEELLKENGIEYEPLTKDNGAPAVGDDAGPEDGDSKSGRRSTPKDGGQAHFREMWHVMRRDVCPFPPRLLHPSSLNLTLEVHAIRGRFFRLRRRRQRGNNAADHQESVGSSQSKR